MQPSHPFARLIHSLSLPGGERTGGRAGVVPLLGRGQGWVSCARKFQTARAHFAIALALVLAGAGCATVGESKKFPRAEEELRAVLEQQARDWNAGNVQAFMRGYAKSDSTRFASGGDVVRGWQTVFDRYVKKYPDRAAMGTLTFSDLEITVLSPDAAVVLGRWRLKRAQDEPNGVFTLIFRKTTDGWRIVHDHTSAASPN